MIINQKSPTDFSGFYVIYKGSVLNEEPKNYGISHLMEHLMCKSFDHLLDDFDRYGISWNAYTSNTEIVFHFTGLDEYTQHFRDEFVESLKKFDITKEQFETERNIVIQEYKDTFSDQQSAHMHNLLRTEYGSYLPIGKLQVLEALTYSDILTFRKAHLLKPSMIINVSKNSDYDKKMDFAEPKLLMHTPELPENRVVEKMADFQKASVIGYQLVKADLPHIKIINYMLSGSLQAPLLYEIREKRGLTYGAWMHTYPGDEYSGILMTGCITTPDKSQEVVDTYKHVLNNPDEFLTEERFKIARDYFVVSAKKKKINRYSNINDLIKAPVWDITSILDTVTFDDIKRVYDKYYYNFKWDIQQP